LEQADGYRLIRQIGNGLSGPVWTADGPTVRVALRQFVSHAVQGSEDWVGDRAHFLQSGRAGLNLKTPKVVQVLEAIDDGADAWIAMEFIQDETLDSLLSKDRVPVERATYMLRVAAVTLDHAHRSGVVHGDLKPSNIFVGSDSSVKISDFAISPRAKRNRRGTMSSDWVHPYLSPEHLLSPATIGPKSDQYALAAIAYFMYTGQAPFARGADDPGPAILRGDLPLASSVNRSLPRGMDLPLLKALSRDPGQRYESCMQLIEALAAGLLPVASSPTSEKRRSAPAIMYAGIGSLVLALIVAGVLLRGRSQSGIQVKNAAAVVTRSTDAPAAVSQVGEAANTARQTGQRGSSGKADSAPARNTQSAREPAAIQYTKPHPLAFPGSGTSQTEAIQRPQREPRYDPPAPVEPNARPAAVSIPVAPLRSAAPDTSLVMANLEGAPKGFSLAVYSRSKPVGNGISFGFRDPVLGELGAGDLTARVLLNGPAGKGRLSLEWSIEGTPMNARFVNANSVVAYQNEPTPGTYKVTLRQDAKTVAEHTFRIIP
jgi:serine/threonine protein kinase